MDKKREYRLKIEGFTPDTLAMARLAEYLADLAGLLGNAENVHFERLEPGSTSIVHWAEAEVYPDIQRRMKAIQSGKPPKDAARAFAGLTEKLTEDHATASLFTPEPGNILLFPGKATGDAVPFPPIVQAGTVEGVLISIGGRNDPVPVHLAEGEHVHLCDAPRGLARELAPYLFGPVLRVRGNGAWLRDPAGNWMLNRFHIEGFDALEDVPLTRVVQDLREIPGSGWRQVADPLEELRRLRHGAKRMEKAG